jgi:hypothetical protein
MPPPAEKAALRRDEGYFTNLRAYDDTCSATVPPS